MRTATLLLALLALLGLAVPALAATRRTARTPAELRAGKPAYDRKIRAGWATATRRLDAQLERKPKKPAAVLDIDETTMSNWGCLQKADFALSGLAVCVASGRSVAYASAKRFIAHARKRKVRIAFVTGAPAALCASRRKNLAAQGIHGPFSLTCRPASDTRDSLVPYKTAARKALRAKGLTLVLNVGDQRSDLAGGVARATVLLPNPVYVTP